jgi:DNA-binding XRE family transcriptional regulator
MYVELYDTTMKTKPNKSVKALRQIIGRTQAEFAALIGASKDTVVSWENGRNKLSKEFAVRIRQATGADDAELLRGKGHPRTYGASAVVLYPSLDGGDPKVERWPWKPEPYTSEFFNHHRERRCSPEAVRHYLEDFSDALGLLLQAAAKSGGGRIRDRLPAVAQSFVEWCERTGKDFQLVTQIDELLAQRRVSFEIGTYGELRKDQSLKPFLKTEKWESDDDIVQAEFAPKWSPGIRMRDPFPYLGSRLAAVKRLPKQSENHTVPASDDLCSEL